MIILDSPTNALPCSPIPFATTTMNRQTYASFQRWHVGIKKLTKF
jgi:hypothetical protein